MIVPPDHAHATAPTTAHRIANSSLRPAKITATRTETTQQTVAADTPPAAPAASAHSANGATHPDQPIPQVAIGFIFSPNGKRVLLKKAEPYTDPPLLSRTFTSTQHGASPILALFQSSPDPFDTLEWDLVAIMTSPSETNVFLAASLSTRITPAGWKWYRNTPALTVTDDAMDSAGFALAGALRGRLATVAFRDHLL